MSRFRLDILPLLVAAIALIAGCTTTPVSELPPTATVEEPTMAPPEVVQTEACSSASCYRVCQETTTWSLSSSTTPAPTSSISRDGRSGIE